MNESELISAYHGAEQIWQGYVSVFVSIVFAYIVVAYLVGVRLARSQAIIITGLYCLAGFSFLALLSIVFIRMQEIGTNLLAVNPAWSSFASGEYTGGMVGGFILWGPFIGAFLAGLLFMFQIRRKTRK